MFRVIAYLTLIVCFGYGVLFMGKYLPYMIESYGPEQLVLYGNQVNLPKNATRRLEYLNQLVEMPILGRFFLQEKVMELISLNMFNQSLLWAKKALSDPFSTRSFPIWYHKALAECFLRQYSQCESSLTWASVYASPQAEPYLDSIYRFLETNSKIQKREIELSNDRVIVVEMAKEESTSEMEQL